jgi:hypothetical protein
LADLGGWYQRILDGTDTPPEIERAYVFLDPPNLWEQGPEVVNAAIAKRLKEIAEREEGIETAIRDAFDKHSILTSDLPEALPDVRSPIDFGWSGDRITVTAGAFNTPLLQAITSKRDHANRLQACRISASDLWADLTSQTYQVRREYGVFLKRYTERLSDDPETANILLADAEARKLRNMFGVEAHELPVGFASALKTILENHIGLRAFYPELSAFFEDVRTGALSAQAPQEAFDQFIRAVAANDPVFDASVGKQMSAVAEPVAATASLPEPPLTASQAVILPPVDPIGQVDEAKTRNKGIAAAANRLWDVFKKGKDVKENSEAWWKAANDLRPWIEKIIEWLSGPGGGPPSLPPTISI